MARKRRRMLTIRRKGYWRKAYVRKDGVRVKRTYVPPTTFKIRDVGAPGRGPKLIPIKKDMLGYSTAWPAAKRRRHLRKLIAKRGAAKVWRQLHAQVILRKRKPGRARRVFMADRDWVAREYGGPVPRAAIARWKGMTPLERARAMPGGRG